MISDALWLSNRCPYFSVFDALVYDSHFPQAQINKADLLELNFAKAASWLLKNGTPWKKQLDDLKREEEAVKNKGGQVLCWHDKSYPQHLRGLYFPPSILFALGNVDALNGPLLSIVGSRQPTYLGLQWMHAQIPLLIEKGYTLVSGGARGVDYEVHELSLKNKGQTVAILPGGVTKPYPKSNCSLFEKILERSGALLSEYIEGDPVRRESFYKRNRVIAGCSPATVILEAKLKSGTLMTAGKARDENREVLVLPGHPLMENYQGSLQLIAQGAHLIQSAQDILEKLL